MDTAAAGAERATRVLLLGGIGRSGTTILERSLETDARITALGEVNHLWKRSLINNELCGCGAPFSECPFWTEVGGRAFGGWSNVDPVRVLDLKTALDRATRAPKLAFRLGSRRWRRDLSEYASYYARIYRAAADLAGTEVVIDSSKQASLPYVLMHEAALDLRVLHCVRDSRAVAYSWTRKVARPEARGARDGFMTQYSPVNLSAMWMLHNAILEGLRARGVSTMRLRYEDWVTDPEALLAQTHAFVGLSRAGQNPSVGADWVDLGASHTCSGNPMRFQQGRVHIRADDRWRTDLPRGSRVLVTVLTSPLLMMYRYLRGSR